MCLGSRFGDLGVRHRAVYSEVLPCFQCISTKMVPPPYLLSWDSEVVRHGKHRVAFTDFVQRRPFRIGDSFQLLAARRALIGMISFALPDVGPCRHPTRSLRRLMRPSCDTVARSPSGSRPTSRDETATTPDSPAGSPQSPSEIYLLSRRKLQLIAAFLRGSSCAAVPGSAPGSAGLSTHSATSRRSIG